MIEEAVLLGAAPVLRIDAVKALQQRWQAEAQSVLLERKHEQKLWDAFRQPIDEAFNRKTAERERGVGEISAHDRAVIDAAKALDGANASGDAQKIRAAMAGLDAALRGQAQAREEASAAENKQSNQPVAQQNQAVAAIETEAEESAPVEDTPAADATDATDASDASDASDAVDAAPVEAAPVAPPKPAARRVVAVRGDDRPGMKKDVPAAMGRGGRPGERRDERPGRDAGRPGPGGAPRGPRDDARGGSGGRFGERPAYEDRGPRLGDAAFRAQREAMEHAQQTLKKLAAQAHGEALTQLLTAWEKRDAALLPSTQELGAGVTAAVRNAWTQALQKPAAGDAAQALLRLEMASETPTPADHLPARSALQLQLLTRRNDPAPAQTWGQDTATVLASANDAASARRLQNTLKALLRKQ